MLAGIYKTRPKQDRVIGAESDSSGAVEPAIRFSNDRSATAYDAPALESGERGIEAPGDPIQEGLDCWECRLTAEVHRHPRGQLWQEGYRVPCNCAEVGRGLDGVALDPFIVGHHYRCIWWSFQERIARKDAVPF